VVQVSEHVERYRFAARLARGRRVLDVACGTGYGSAILAHAGAPDVLGVDASPTAVDYARARYGAVAGVRFLVGDGAAVPVPTGSVDLVVSFETLEHVPDAEAFLDELHRVVARDGRVVLSTPNRLVTSPTGRRPYNPYHVREFDPAELARSLARRFGSVELYGQTQAWRGLPARAKFLGGRVLGTVAPLRRLWPRVNALTALLSPRRVTDTRLAHLRGRHEIFPLPAPARAPPRNLVAVCSAPRRDRARGPHTGRRPTRRRM
jgi:SAM-dependent methyltransferase